MCVVRLSGLERAATRVRAHVQRQLAGSREGLAAHRALAVLVDPAAPVFLGDPSFSVGAACRLRLFLSAMRVCGGVYSLGNERWCRPNWSKSTPLVLKTKPFFLKQILNEIKVNSREAFEQSCGNWSLALPSEGNSEIERHALKDQGSLFRVCASNPLLSRAAPPPLSGDTLRLPASACGSVAPGPCHCRPPAGPRAPSFLGDQQTLAGPSDLHSVAGDLPSAAPPSTPRGLHARRCVFTRGQGALGASA